MTSRIRQEIKQQKPFTDRYHESSVALLHTADLVRRRFTAAITPSGLTAQQYNVLRILRGAGPAGLPTLEIAGRLVEQTPGITRLCDTLHARGLLSRTRSRTDRRVVECRITPAGLALLSGLDAVVRRADRTMLGAVRQTDLGVLLRILDAIRADPGQNSTSKERNP